MATTDPYYLSKGSHPNAAEGRCAMEWVAYLAGEPHSDQPGCVSAVLRAYCIRFNDLLGDADRQKLRPYLARTIGTAGDGRDDERVEMLTTWLLRERLAPLLDGAGCARAAEQLRRLPVDVTLDVLEGHLRYARDEARKARQQARQRLQKRLLDASAAIDASAASAASAAIDASAASAAIDAIDAIDGSAAIDASAASAAIDAIDASAASAAIDASAASAAIDASAASAAIDASAASAAIDAIAASAAIAAIAAEKYQAVYAAVRKEMDARLAPIREERVRWGFELLERMLPTVPLQLPVAADADRVCAVA
jgi:hypothetical protein